MTKIKIQPMLPADYNAYMAVSIPEYAAEKRKAEGLSDEESMKVANESFARLLPQGLGTPDHFLYSLLEPASGRKIGMIWFARAKGDHAFIYDFKVDADQRGRGFGKAALAAAEAEARAKGFRSIGLHVFGHNEVARKLYETSGYRTTNVNMKKDL